MIIRTWIGALALILSCTSRPPGADDLTRLAIFREVIPVSSAEEAERYLQNQQRYIQDLLAPKKLPFTDLSPVPSNCLSSTDQGTLTKNNGRLYLITKARVDHNGRVGNCSRNSYVVWNVFEYCPRTNEIINLKIPQRHVTSLVSVNLCNS